MNTTLCEKYREMSYQTITKRSVPLWHTSSRFTDLNISFQALCGALITVVFRYAKPSWVVIPEFAGMLWLSSWLLHLYVTIGTSEDIKERYLFWTCVVIGIVIIESIYLFARILTNLETHGKTRHLRVHDTDVEKTDFSALDGSMYPRPLYQALTIMTPPAIAEMSQPGISSDTLLTALLLLSISAYSYFVVCREAQSPSQQVR